MKASLQNLLLILIHCFVGSTIWSCTTKDVELPVLAPSANLLINEVLYDPSNAGLVGDANGDGIYNQSQDEFIELVNSGNASINLSGYTISDVVKVGGLKTIRFTFPDSSFLAAGKSLVVFGGGTPTGTFGGSQVYLAQDAGGLNMNNSGESIYVTDSTGKDLLIFDSDLLSDNPNESYTRNPDILGSFLQHSTAFPGKFFSPGTKIDGTTF